MVIDITPTWKGVLPLLLATFESGNFAGKDLAMRELKRMAEIADQFVEYSKKMEKPSETSSDTE